MTRPVNLYLLSRIHGKDAFNSVFQHVSEKLSAGRTPLHEIESLRVFADGMIGAGVPVDALDGFFFGYKIPQIGKEFDLLKFGAGGVLSIELKSQPVPLEQIRAQLLRNRHYLGHLGRQMQLFTFVSDTQQCFRLTAGDVLAAAAIDDIAKAVLSFAGGCETEIDGMFRPSEYIVSPAGTPEKFLGREYFLTQAQDQIRRDLLAALNETTGLAWFSLIGKPGTGKTLLLYDVGRTLGAQARTAILHWGPLTDSHRMINDAGIGLTILPWEALEGAGADGAVPPREGVDSADSDCERPPREGAGAVDSDCGLPTREGMESADTDRERPLREGSDAALAPALAPYSYVLVDESHRLSPQQFRVICRTAEACRQRVVFCLDPEQILTTAERRSDIAGRIESLPPSGAFVLSERLRGNRELQAFIQEVRDLNVRPKNHMAYRDVDLGFASTIAEARAQLAYYRERGYVFINYYRAASAPAAPCPDATHASAPADIHSTAATPSDTGSTPVSPADTNPFADFEGGYDIHHVIGQEFDRVVLLLDSSFYYTDEGKLEGIPSPDPDILYPNLFYQSITRVQEKLALIVLENDPLFDRIAAILD